MSKTWTRIKQIGKGAHGTIYEVADEEDRLFKKADKEV
jgi:hypothetical protein